MIHPGRYLAALLSLAWLACASRAAEETRSYHFANDIVPLLSRYQCNSSGCHGKAEGQNGFKLSVFGFDPAADYASLVTESRGRRVLPSAPEASLLLRNAVDAVFPLLSEAELPEITFTQRKVEAAPFPSVFRGCCRTPLLIQEGWTRHQERCREATFDGADGVVRHDETLRLTDHY